MYSKKTVKKGDKIAQLILERILEIDECVEVDNLDETERGSGNCLITNEP